MTNMAEIRKIFYDLLDEIGFDREELNSEANLELDLGIDSVEVVEVAAAIEKKFNISVDPIKLFEYETLGEVVQFIENLVGEKNA